eukprot:4964193-Pleurochrysis_carterae.AAC.1
MVRARAECAYDRRRQRLVHAARVRRRLCGQGPARLVAPVGHLRVRLRAVGAAGTRERAQVWAELARVRERSVLTRACPQRALGEGDRVGAGGRQGLAHAGEEPQRRVVGH